MCLIFFAINHHPEYDLILTANRDEFYARPTAPAHFWKDYPDILAGQDLQDPDISCPGTWLGIKKSGRMAMLTNYRDLRKIKSNVSSRGKLVSDFLSGQTEAFQYLEGLEEKVNQFNGFNLLVGDSTQLYYLSSEQRGIKILNSGIFGISNHLLDSPWPKVVNGKRKFTNILSSGKSIHPNDLIEMMYDSIQAPEDQLPDTGMGITREKMLSPAFIKTEDYGTRCTTVILINKNGEVSFTEKSYQTSTEVRHFEFKIAN
jgi:uncharacterized protein with NRDE domain